MVRHCPKCGETAVVWKIQARRFKCQACGEYVARWELREDGQQTCELSVMKE